MKGNMTVIIGEDLMLIRIKEMAKNTRITKIFRIQAIFIWFPFLAFQGAGMLAEGDEMVTRIVLILGTTYLLWESLYGYRAAYVKREKKRMRKIKFPIEQILEFDESGIVVRTDFLEQKLFWDKMDMVCEDENYWFLGKVGVIIDKKQLTQEQIQFIAEKCESITRGRRMS